MNVNRLTKVVLGWIVLGGFGDSFALAADPKPSDESSFVAPQFENPTFAARDVASGLLSSTEAPGLSVAVEVDGTLVWSEAFGLADRENGIPATRSTVYRIGSVSKLLTVAALAKLIDQGRMSLDSPISRYVPGYPDAKGGLTIRRLAGHTAGVRHYAGAREFLSQVHCDTVTDALAIFQGDELLFDPGTRYAYSSHGYVLLSAGMEKAAGTPFLELIRTNVLNPLRMSSTAAETGDAKSANRSARYSLWQGRVADAPAVDVSCRWAAGGYLSTAEDLAKFLSAHLDGRLFGPELLRVLFKSQQLADGKETGVGIGWRIGTDSVGRRFMHHGGDIVGGRAFVLLYPDQKVALAICTNLGSAPFAEKEALAIVAPFLDSIAVEK